MPNTLDGTLQPVFKLKEKSEFIKWEYRVYAYLELLDLEDLVSDLPRPNRNAPSYTKWRKHSKMVRTWLISAIHNDLLDDIIYHLLLFDGHMTPYTDTLPIDSSELSNTTDPASASTLDTSMTSS